MTWRRKIKETKTNQKLADIEPIWTSNDTKTQTQLTEKKIINK